MRGAKISAEEFHELATSAVPYVGLLGCSIERLDRGAVDVRLPWCDLLVRPGGTICGPAMMALADITIYGVVLSLIGRVELAVTTSLNIHFLSRPKPTDLIARGRILRLGTRLAVAEARIEPAGDAVQVGHATATYAIPPEEGA